MGNALQPAHLLILLLIILLLFGAAKLPALAKSLGQSARAFKGEMKAMKEDDATDAATSAAPVVTSEAAPQAGATPAQPQSPSTNPDGSRQ
ncbi:hypothetical protein GCM10009860_01690 [Microbacterium mitrae]|uniref:Sec-independent protein translocase protein TatA n=1 Tax=Microbacterium mitrae TaxID=664640 RepID=A0A5C8HNM1_9MICO|nr:Sec-independent protein translocase subunit TatA [Microbacterium mitrae]TXK05584.1 twin-arginine translocase TatA/TatE family subunit [Microbacterium mitrae]